MTTSIKNMLVGIFILSSIVLLVWIIMFLKPTVGDGKQHLQVRFSNVTGLNIGTRVMFAGKPVGEIVSMNEIHEAREQPTDELGRVYFYQLQLDIDSCVKVYNTDEISIQTSGLMGEKSIAITPKAPPKGVTPRQISNQPIYADSVDPIQNAMLDFSDLASQMEETFHRASDWLKDHGEEVATTVRSAGNAMNEMDQALAVYNQADLTHDLQKTIRGFSGALDQFHLAMEQMQSKQTFKNTGVVMQNLKSATHSLDVAAEDISKGKGTLGRLITDDDLYLQLNAVMTKANGLMNDVNQYGVLFHLNKQWQRTHVQKASKLNALNTPESFRAYFQNEVDDINSSMTRISMLIEKAENSPERERIMQSDDFKVDFADLLRRVDELSDNLRLYNQQLRDAHG